MTDNSVFDFEFKIIVIGEVGVGKECILNRYCKDNFTTISDHTVALQYDKFTATANYGIQYYTKNIDVIIGDGGSSSNSNSNKSYRVKLILMRDKPVERFTVLHPSFYKKADAIILVYDTTNISTFNKLSNWITTLRNIYSNELPPTTIVGNKCDAHPQINADPQQYHNSSLQIQSFQHAISAKESININELFQTVVTSIINKQIQQQPGTNNNNNKNNWCNII